MPRQKTTLTTVRRLTKKEKDQAERQKFLSQLDGSVVNSRGQLTPLSKRGGSVDHNLIKISTSTYRHYSILK